MKRTLAALAGGPALLALLVGCGSDEGSAAETFTIDSGVGGMAQAVYPSGKCTFYDDMLSPGDAVIVKGGDDTILGKTELVRAWMSPDHSNGTQASADGGSDVCSFTFRLDGIKAGESAYQIQIGSYAPIVASEADLQVNSYRPRDAVSAAMGNDAITAFRDEAKHPASAPAGK